jgi:hypothetical protein
MTMLKDGLAGSEANRDGAVQAIDIAELLAERVSPGPRALMRRTRELSVLQ